MRQTCLQLDTKTIILEVVCVRRNEKSRFSFCGNSHTMYDCWRFVGVAVSAFSCTATYSGSYLTCNRSACSWLREQ